MLTVLLEKVFALLTAFDLHAKEQSHNDEYTSSERSEHFTY